MLFVAHQRRHLRRTACLTLVAWLLALAAGVANACLLQASAAAVVDAPAASGSDHADHGDAASHDGRAACQKFCVDETTTLTKKGGKPFDVSPPAIIAFALQPHPADVCAVRLARRFAEAPDRPGPSLVIRLLRLTT